MSFSIKFVTLMDSKGFLNFAKASATENRLVHISYIVALEPDTILSEKHRVFLSGVTISILIPKDFGVRIMIKRVNLVVVIYVPCHKAVRSFRLPDNYSHFVIFTPSSNLLEPCLFLFRVNKEA